MAIMGWDGAIVHPTAFALMGNDRIDADGWLTMFIQNEVGEIELGYVLKSVVLGNLVEMQKWNTDFTKICNLQENQNFKGYALQIDALMKNDVDESNRALAVIVEGHKKESKSKGLFRDSEDELDCVWGIGLVNLSRQNFGLFIKSKDRLIPEELLFPSTD